MLEKSTNTESGTVKGSNDFLPINGTDHVEFYVSNALQAAHYYQHAFGFKPLAYRGLSTGERETESYVLQQDKVIFVLTSPLVGGTDVGRHIDKHGDGVKSIALMVDDAAAAYEATTSRGAPSYFKPTTISDDHGDVILASIKLYGDTVHVFVERNDYNGVFLPGYEAWDIDIYVEPVGFMYIDHMVANVDWGKMNKWAEFYVDVMGFSQLLSFDDKDISTEYTALMSKVMTNDNGRIKFPINEPAKGKKRSQIEEFLIFNGGPGVQHIALTTDDIINTVSTLQTRGVDFLTVPKSYYDSVLDRVGAIDEDISRLCELGILVDRDDEGYLLQIFTKPLQSRPTLFFEIIQRKGAVSFGKGNFKALFESLEREQALRGTL